MKNNQKDDEEKKKRIEELKKREAEYGARAVVSWREYQDEQEKARHFGGTTLHEPESMDTNKACSSLYKMYTREKELKTALAGWLVYACAIENICETGKDMGMEAAKRSAKNIAPSLFGEGEEYLKQLTAYI